jgi:ATPase subunit of ABC transporter with duplicated ATPase domains
MRKGAQMASYQFVYHMDGVSKTYPGGKKCFENIRLSFLPGVKIGVVGVNGAGKSTLLRIMAGWDKDFTGEAWAAEGAHVGYLPQEPQLDESLTVRENVMLGVAEKKAKLDRFNELAMNYSDETAEEMAQLQDEIDAQNLWDLDSQIDVAMEALRCPPDDAGCRQTSRAANAAAWRSASCCSKRPTCCSWTSPPTTSMPRPSPGSSST